MIIGLFLFAGASLSLLMAAGQLVIREKALRNYLFAFFFITLTAIQLHGFMLQKQLQVLPIDIPLVFTTGPIVLYLYREITQTGYAMSWRDFLHMLPVPIAFVLAMTIDYHQILFVMGMAASFLYIAAIARSTTFIWRLDLKPGQRPIQLILGSAIFVASSVVIMFLFWFDLALLRTTIYPLMFTGIMFYCIIVGHRYPELYQLTTRAKAAGEYKKSSLAQADAARIGKQLAAAMTDEKVYEDEELTLRALARHLQITPHQLSEYLNQRLGTNFPSMVNGYRVEAAKKMLLEDPDEDVLTIAYQVGFGSKSSFNRAFMTFAAQSPSEFRARASG